MPPMPPTAACAAARGAGDEAVAALPPLLGIPVALKDLVVTKGRPSTAGSRILEGFVSPYDAHIAERLDEAGAVVPGKTNMDEFAMGSSTEHSAWGPDRQPLGPRRGCPGGSSGGSAAAVAAHHVPLGIGTDTGGSIRQPAALLRRRRAEAHLRPRQPLRHHRLRLLARPDRAVRARRARCGHAAAGDRRARRARLDVRAAARAGLVGGAAR